MGREMEKNSDVAVIILAAGLGKRMKSDKAKVLHEILGRPMIQYVAETAKRVAETVIPVIGHQSEKVREVILSPPRSETPGTNVGEKDVSEDGNLHFAFQKEQLGTGHAVLCALPHIPEDVEEVVILCGDVPLIRADTLARFMEDHKSARRDISLLAVQIDRPDGYGRLLVDDNRRLVGIVEESDATEEQKMIKTINSGIYCVKKNFLKDALQKLTPDNAQGEFYLTDIIAIGHEEGKLAGVMIGSRPDEVMGVNTLDDLKMVEMMMRSGNVQEKNPL